FFVQHPRIHTGRLSVDIPIREDDNRSDCYIFACVAFENFSKPLCSRLCLDNRIAVGCESIDEHLFSIVRDFRVPTRGLRTGFYFNRKHSARSDNNMIDIKVINADVVNDEELARKERRLQVLADGSLTFQPELPLRKILQHSVKPP